MPRVAGYVYATSAEEGRAGLSVAEQRSRIEEFAAQRQWPVSEVFEDAGAGAGERRALDDLLAHLEGVDKVLVASLHRLGAAPGRLHHAVERLHEAGVDLVSVDDVLEANASDGQALRQVLSLLAQWQPKRGVGSGWTPKEVAQRGFAPATVIDVGAGRGTPLLYRAFPRAYHVMVEPLPEFEPELRRILEQRRGELLATAIGSDAGTVTLNVNPSCLLESSINEAPGMTAVPRDVPITTLDALLAEHEWIPPFALKIDTEGFEHRVIEGGTALLEHTQMVIAEVSVARRFEGSYTFAEFVALMAARDFELCDVVNVVKAASGDVTYMDCAFRKMGGLRTG